MADQIFIQRRFTITQGDQTLQDAIVLPEAEYNALSDKDIENLKQERFNNWQEVIKNPPPPEKEPSKEEVIASLDEQISSLTQQKESLEASAQVSEVSINPTPIKDK